MHARSTPGGYRAIADKLDDAVSLIVNSQRDPHTAGKLSIYMHFGIALLTSDPRITPRKRQRRQDPTASPPSPEHSHTPTNPASDESLLTGQNS
ncbi:hypothetical protein I546_2984 [Mycobacterium kansasii 732]|uniref:Uncharacterized protein n=1 Tax=Mycobacterium pseudokansasii TaxID=2341080 RepID=A0A498QZX2_9MYCO|nr:hypothetical protein I546_2984 [Mycobacterium kansasii 732]KZS63807.1 hypothetical protein A4G27_07805 [Mycobacterium kansasii]VBA29879.1 hypothetical protein LAUMK35_04561 [Mycobacterium pseudokansasii]VBA31367.1 hypothetical protein LAUMK21_04554 [Mycobacterium pseudokansasii]VBA54035.1 hypothetical protein LAUMK142_04457 [Mycobacterium pseudokansasii]